jgi:hypothetical protein
MSLPGMEISFRPMTNDEFGWHVQAIRPHGWRKAVELAAIAYLATTLPLAVLFDHVPAIKSLELPTMIPYLACWIWFCILYAGNYPVDLFRPALLRELADRQIAMTLYHAVAAIKVEEFEDEGSNYFVLLRDGTVVFISGQYLYEAEEAGAFPCTEFVVGRTTVMQSSREFSTGGTPIPISCTLPPFPEEALGTPQVPFDSDIIPIPWKLLLAGHKLLPEPAE